MFISCEQNEEFTNQFQDKSSERIDDKKFKWNEVYRYNFTSKDVIPMDIVELPNSFDKEPQMYIR